MPTRQDTMTALRRAGHDANLAPITTGAMPLLDLVGAALSALETTVAADAAEDRVHDAYRDMLEAYVVHAQALEAYLTATEAVNAPGNLPVEVTEALYFIRQRRAAAAQTVLAAVPLT